jgi:uncharacterized protein HemY
MLELLAQEEDPETNANLAWTCSLSPDTVKDWTPVVERARLAVFAAPDDPAALRALGAALYRAGQWREARDTLAYALRMNPHDAIASQFLAFTIQQLGEDPAAFDVELAGSQDFRWDERLMLRLLRQERLDSPRDGSPK